LWITNSTLNYILTENWCNSNFPLLAQGGYIDAAVPPYQLTIEHAQLGFPNEVRSVVFQTLIVLVCRYEKPLSVEFARITDDSAVRLEVTKGCCSLVLEDVEKGRRDSERGGLDYHLELHTDDGVLL
jgi:hypothetical protein